MKLYMNQKIFSWKDKFSIKDEAGNDRYFIEGQVISLGKKLHIYDVNQNEVAFVREKVISFRPKFFVEMNGEQVAEIVKKMSLLKPKYFVDGPDWEVKGNFLSHDYDIIKGEETIVSIHKKWMTWGDSFEIEIMDPRNEVFAMAVVLAIDAVMDSQS